MSYLSHMYVDFYNSERLAVSAWLLFSPFCQNYLNLNLQRLSKKEKKTQKYIPNFIYKPCTLEANRSKIRPEIIPSCNFQNKDHHYLFVMIARPLMTIFISMNTGDLFLKGSPVIPAPRVLSDWKNISM